MIHFKIKNRKEIIKKNIKFSFFFTSYISPYLLINLKFFLLCSFKKKNLIKQSYLLLSWFLYLTFLTDTQCKLNFFIMPLKKFIFTLTKAPIAHKTWSKEQYKIQFFFIKISFYTNLYKFINLNSTNVLLLLLIIKNQFIFFETNLFFLKNFNLLFILKNYLYWNYYYYHNYP